MHTIFYYYHSILFTEHNLLKLWMSTTADHKTHGTHKL